MIINYVFVNQYKQKIDFNVTGAMPVITAEGINGHEIDISEIQTVNQIGSTVTYTSVPPKNILLTGYIKENVEYNRKQILNVFRPVMTGTLYAIIDNKELYSIEAVIKQSPIIGGGNTYMPFEIDLHIPYPFWKKGNSIGISESFFIPLFSFPRNYSIPFKFSDTFRKEYLEATNLGNEPTPLKATVVAKGPLVNPKITNMVTGDFIKLNYSAVDKEIITITTGYNNKKVLSSVNGNIFKSVDVKNSRFFQLEPGEVKLKLEADSGYETALITVEFDEVVSAI